MFLVSACDFLCRSLLLRSPIRIVYNSWRCLSGIGGATTACSCLYIAICIVVLINSDCASRTLRCSGASGLRWLMKFWMSVLKPVKSRNSSGSRRLLLRATRLLTNFFALAIFASHSTTRCSKRVIICTCFSCGAHLDGGRSSKCVSPCVTT